MLALYLQAKKWRLSWRHFFDVCILGFISGLPLSIVGTTLAAWFSTEGVSLASIGLLSLVHQPYSLKFLWSPLLDSPIIKSFGRRKGWLLVCQSLLCALLITLSLLSPNEYAFTISIIALLMAFISATQDIAADAWRAEILTAKERGPGATLAIFSYRLATVISGAFALVVADRLGWPVTLCLLSFLIVLCMIATFFINEPCPLTSAKNTSEKRGGWLSIIKQLLKQKQTRQVMLLILLFKLGEAFTASSSTIMMPFLLQTMGFSLTTVGVINKGVGIAALMAGSLIAGIMLHRTALHTCLLRFGLLQIVMNMLFVGLVLVGKNTIFLSFCVLFDNLAAGMTMTALVVLMMAACDQRFTATHFALFTAVSALPRLLAGPVAALIVGLSSWLVLFIVAVLLAIPAVIYLWFVDIS